MPQNLGDLLNWDALLLEERGRGVAQIMPRQRSSHGTGPQLEPAHGTAPKLRIGMPLHVRLAHFCGAPAAFVIVPLDKPRALHRPFHNTFGGLLRSRPASFRIREQVLPGARVERLLNVWHEGARDRKQSLTSGLGFIGAGHGSFNTQEKALEVHLRLEEPKDLLHPQGEVEAHCEVSAPPLGSSR